jgi:hypothetical protein
MKITFRFQDFDIWQRSAAIKSPLFELAAELETRKRFRWAE